MKWLGRSGRHPLPNMKLRANLMLRNREVSGLIPPNTRLSGAGPRAFNMQQKWNPRVRCSAIVRDYPAIMSLDWNLHPRQCQCPLPNMVLRQGNVIRWWINRESAGQVVVISASGGYDPAIGKKEDTQTAILQPSATVNGSPQPHSRITGQRNPRSSRCTTAECPSRLGHELVRSVAHLPDGRRLLDTLPPFERPGVRLVLRSDSCCSRLPCRRPQRRSTPVAQHIQLRLHSSENYRGATALEACNQ